MALTHITRLAFGRAIPMGGEVTDTDWQQFADQHVATAFPDGFTVIHADGGWRDARTGETITEPTVIVEVAHTNEPETLKAIRALAGAYKLIFAQDAVMATTTAATVEFI